MEIQAQTSKTANATTFLWQLDVIIITVENITMRSLQCGARK